MVSMNGWMCNGNMEGQGLNVSNISKIPHSFYESHIFHFLGGKITACTITHHADKALNIISATGSWMFRPSSPISHLLLMTFIF